MHMLGMLEMLGMHIFEAKIQCYVTAKLCFLWIIFNDVSLISFGTPLVYNLLYLYIYIYIYIVYSLYVYIGFMDFMFINLFM